MLASVSIRQRADVAAMCRNESTEIWAALLGDQLVGFVGLRAHVEDSMGEVHMGAVDPSYQRRGFARSLLDFSFERMRQRDLSMAMVETGGDDRQAPSRAAYESAGFERNPVARCFRPV